MTKLTQPQTSVQQEERLKGLLANGKKGDAKSVQEFLEESKNVIKECTEGIPDSENKEKLIHDALVDIKNACKTFNQTESIYTNIIEIAQKAINTYLANRRQQGPVIESIPSPPISDTGSPAESDDEPLVSAQTETAADKATVSEELQLEEFVKKRALERQLELGDEEVIEPGIVARVKENDTLKKNMGAYRVGANAIADAVLDASGIQRNVISDHIPVTYTREQDDLTVTSWNLLADVHRNNNYANVKEDYLTGMVDTYAMTQKTEDGEPIDCDFGYYNARNERELTMQDGTSINVKECDKKWFFSDIADAVSMYEQGGGDVTLMRIGDDGETQRFMEFLEQSWTIDQTGAVSGSEEPRDEQITTRTQGRKYMLDMIRGRLEQPTPPDDVLATRQDDFMASVVNADKMKKTLDTGALSWASRREKLQHNQPLIDHLKTNQFLCLQECTNPADIHGIIDPQQDTFGFISFKTDEKADNVSAEVNERLTENNPEKEGDHCAIYYDKTKWDCQGIQRFSLAARKKGKPGNKPALACVFVNKATGKTFVLSSIHHPGHGKSEVAVIMDQLKQLRTKHQLPEDTPYMICGDFNNNAAKINHMIQQDEAVSGSEINVINPEGASGTMAGPDWGDSHRGDTIDVALSNENWTGENVMGKL